MPPWCISRFSKRIPRRTHACGAASPTVLASQSPSAVLPREPNKYRQLLSYSQSILALLNFCFLWFVRLRRNLKMHPHTYQQNRAHAVFFFLLHIYNNRRALTFVEARNSHTHQSESQAIGIFILWTRRHLLLLIWSTPPTQSLGAALRSRCPTSPPCSARVRSRRCTSRTVSGTRRAAASRAFPLHRRRHYQIAQRPAVAGRADRRSRCCSAHSARPVHTEYNRHRQRHTHTAYDQYPAGNPLSPPSSRDVRHRKRCIF